jgi:hypothetical protein
VFTFVADLTEALAATGIGGGTLAGQILTAMEAAATRTSKQYSRYGSTAHALLQKIGPEAAQKPRARVAAEIKTTFASTYTKRVSLAGALRFEEIAVYGRQATGAKYLITPNT